MELTSLIAFLAIGAIAGWIAGILMEGGGFGLLGNILVGILGSFIGGWLLGELGVRLPIENALVGSIVTSVIGASVLLFIVRLIRR